MAKGVQFDSASAKRIADVVRSVERTAPNSRHLGPMGERSFQGGGYITIASVNIPAISEDPISGFRTIASGKATVQKREKQNDPDTGALTDTLVSAPVEITLYNNTNNDIIALQVVRAIQDNYGTYWAVPDTTKIHNTLAYVTEQIPARTAADNPGAVTGYLVQYDPTTGKWEEQPDGASLTVASYQRFASTDPATKPNGKLWVWIEETTDTEGSPLWVWTGEEYQSGASGNRVAYVTVVIPPMTVTNRTEPPSAAPDELKVIKPGGPVSGSMLYYDTDANEMQEGELVDIYSWVTSPSSDPAVDGIDIGSYNAPEMALFVYIEQDPEGLWWFTGQNCTDPPPPLTLTQTTGTLVDPIPSSPGASTGLGFTVAEDHPGIWTINGALTLDLTNVGNNTDISVRIFATIGGVDVGDGIQKDFYRVSGVLETVTWSQTIQLVAADIGSVVDYRVEELTSNSNLISKDARMSFMGPLQ